jgi:hypothetical protein
LQRLQNNFLRTIENYWQCDTFGVEKTPDDGRLRPKHVVRRIKKSENSCIKD